VCAGVMAGIMQDMRMCMDMYMRAGTDTDCGVSFFPTALSCVLMWTTGKVERWSVSSSVAL